MSRVVRLTIAAAAAAILVGARPAAAQTMCNDVATLPNPVIVSGSSVFEPLLRQFAVRLSAEPSPTTIIFTGSTPTCTAVGNVVNGKDLGGTDGVYYYMQDATTIYFHTCTFAAGQKVDVALSEVFYESCADLPQPRPADVVDVSGPVQTQLFVMPKTNTALTYLSYKDAQTIYGCGVSASHPVANLTDPTWVYCRDPSVGQQIVVAKNIGLPPSALIDPKCIDTGTPAGMIGTLTSGFTHPVIGFIVADTWDNTSTALTLLAFQSMGQTQAYYPDSSFDFVDRMNVRDGHYTLWGYHHLIAKGSGGSPSQPAATFIDWITGARTSAKTDWVVIEGTAGLIPQCAMKVKRFSDGGLLSSYSHPQPCHCAFEATSTQTSPPECHVCTTTGQCPSGTSCRRGFCD